MSNEDPETERLIAEFQDVTKQLDEVLKDLEWRKPDVQNEEKLLRSLMETAKKDPSVDVASQAIVVRVLKGVLDDKIAEAERLETRMNELAAEIKKRQAPAAKPARGKKRGQAISKEKE